MRTMKDMVGVPVYVIRNIYWAEKGTTVVRDRMSSRGIILQFLSCNTKGKRIYPGNYFVSWDLYKKGKRKKVVNGTVEARVVKIADMEIIGD